MKKITLILLAVFCCQPAWAEIRNYVMTEYELADESGKVITKAILPEGSNKPMTLTLTLSGLGTNRVTAQFPNWGLSQETQIYPLDKFADWLTWSPTDKANWYYVRHDQGITIIELDGEKVKLHNLGLVKYTYIGTYKRPIN